MPKGYQHLTRDQRCQISALKSRKLTQKDIADAIGISESALSRELRRNQGCRGYDYIEADMLAGIRRAHASFQPRALTGEVLEQIQQHLYEGWSPEQISGRLSLTGLKVSHETIYKWIWKNKRQGGKFYQCLRHRGKKYRKRKSGKAGRGCIPNRVDIEERPFIVEQKSRVG